MIYKSAFKDIIDPARNREPRVTQYRIVLGKSPKLVCAMVHPLAEEPLQPLRADLVTALDVILTRIAEAELRGIRPDCIRLLVQAGAEVTDCPIGFNALEVIQPRGVASCPPITADQPAHIRSLDVVGGAVAFYVDHDDGKPASSVAMRLLQ